MRRLTAILLSMCFTAAAPAAHFETAKPIWPEGREKEKNLTVYFVASVAKPAGGRIVLRLTASTVYRAFLNGEFLGHGPARAAHGYFRVDEWDLTDRLRLAGNEIAIEVAGYNVNSYAWLDQPSFLQAEVVCEGKVLAATAAGTLSAMDKGTFTATRVSERIQRVQRYSFQRPFSEVYSSGFVIHTGALPPGFMNSSNHTWLPEGPTLRCLERPKVKLLDRRVPYPKFDMRPALWTAGQGTLTIKESVSNPWKDRSLTAIGPKLGGYPESELEIIPSILLQKVVSTPSSPASQPAEVAGSLRLNANTYCILDFGTNLTGFIGLKLARRLDSEAHNRGPARVLLAFDEILSNGDVDFKRLGCVNAIDLEGVSIHFESFEPYTLRYLKVMVLGEDCELESAYIRELANPDVYQAHFAAADPRLNRLFEAGRETFRQNAVDIFMDCPSRERAGWLCDSFFTARVAFDLSGNTAVEKNFCENFLLPEKFEFLPEGMLPMCYPADHNDGVYIPNWAMWFVVELEEYAGRSGDRQLVDGLQPRVLKLLDFLKGFENSDGLLEKLPSWVFVEWSKANDFVQDVNYPSNMLYAGTLAAAGRLYNLPELSAKAERIRETIRKQSYDGTFFVDNAVRKDGKLEITRNRSETCQYYAFFFDVATPEKYPELHRTLIEQFGPNRKTTNAFPEIHPSNSFIGNMLRMEMLSRSGRGQQILDESIDYLLYMADRTGTLWENVSPAASCNHGFASHICHTLYRDILGVRQIDPVARVVRLRFADLKMPWCQGRMPLPDGAISLHWWKDPAAPNTFNYRLNTPAGWKVEVEDTAGLSTQRKP